MKLLVILIYILLFNLTVFAQDVIILSNQTEINYIGKQAFFLEDQSNQLVLDSILKPENQSKFQKSKLDVLNFANSPSTFWIKFTVSFSGISDPYLEIGNPMLDNVSFFYPTQNGTYQEKKAGSSFPMSSKEVKLNTILFSLNQNAKTDSTFVFYLKIKSNFPLEIPLLAGKISKLAEHQSFRDSAFSLYMGVMYIMALYNLFIFFLVKDRVYIIYSCFVFSIGSFYLHLKGYLFYFFFGEMPFLNFYTPTFASVVPLLMMFFAASFLKTKKYAPFFHKGFYVFVLIFIISTALNLSGDYAISAPLSQLGASLLSLYLFITAIRTWFKGSPMAKFYLFAWTIYLGSVIVLLLQINSVVPSNAFTSNSVFIGTGIEVWFLSFALAYRINLLKKEKEDAQTENLKLIKEQNEVLEKKVGEKTYFLNEKAEELQQSNEELAVTNEELYQTQEEILAQRDLLENKNVLLEEFTYKIGKSIESAKRIQKAILPSKEKMKELFAEHFVIFKPKDVVSGDFWWANQIQNTNYLIVADCTGHGVSGAMLTMIGSTLLDRIILVLGITEPSEILEKLHSEIQNALQQEKSKNSEGMDIAIICWHYENEDCFMSFSAAKRPLYFVSDRKIEKLAGSRKMVGGFWNNKKLFESKTLTLPAGTTLYLCSDGFTDQNNVERNTFSEKRLLNLLEEIQDLSMAEQKEILKNQLASHMEGTEQRDDILVVGVRI